MIDQLLRPKIAFWAGVALTAISFIVFDFIIPALYLGVQAINFPMTQQFVGVLTSGVESLGQLARLIGPVLIVGALVMLKIERPGRSPREN
ncbi:hypothetical protein [Salinibacterium sp. SWN1162]|uniref:hypothetical protein n=1 Tax=Salinibacterium sp. SWN1162 TaxID=2792053 RepID=UPI0018CD6323|nr:hypothetical protein [Salinibacterium sp. SWN1162]MBH0010034.1 hypothetical protein [Salinibacterium sp. SWN1162]